MKILHLSTTDVKGGAGIAAYRLHKGLIDAGVISEIFVQRKYGAANDVFSSESIRGKSFDFFCAGADKIVSKVFGPKSEEITSPALFASMDLRIIDKMNPDIVHIHWICGGFLSPEKIAKIKKPIVWTMHDMWPFSGAKHYNSGDRSYINGDFSHNNVLDRWTWERKKRAWNGLTITGVSPSAWLEHEAKASYLFKEKTVDRIPNGINVDIFKKGDMLSCRKRFNLPLDKKLILFGAVDPLSGERKGYKLLLDVISELSRSDIGKNVALVIFGSNDDHRVNFGLPTYFTGKLSSEEDLAAIYSAADIFVAPSKEDNLPNTVIESMSCGTPVAAFHIGGMPDMIDDKINGIMVPPFENKTMAKEIISLLSNEDCHARLSDGARKKVLEKFDIRLIVKKYSQLYNSVLHP
ncbi:MAG TPA: glycosyltransferase [Candidatus Paceibacterota bacterium]|nr:glycosyltransferase [Candidatus Paceibacterota bacterium]